MNKSKEEYNKIFKEYEKATERPLRKYAHLPFLKKTLANVSGKKVLDLACGEGQSSRIIYSLGAKEIVGIDISEELIEIAKSKSTGESYFISDVFNENFEDLGKFDVVTMIMAIHYAPSKDKLKHLINQVKKVLVPEGIFYIMTCPPEAFKGYEGYGVKIDGAKKEGESTLTTLSDFEGNVYCSFTNFYYAQRTYNFLLESEGFIVEWIPGFVSEEGIKKYGKEFWNKFYKFPIYTIIRAVLKKVR